MRPGGPPAPQRNCATTSTRAGLLEIVKEDLGTGLLHGAVDVGSMVDTSFVDRLKQSGFIDTLYAR